MTRLTFTVPEAATLLGISRSSAYECVRRGEIASITLGRRVLITRAHLEALLGPLPTDALARNATPSRPCERDLNDDIVDLNGIARSRP